MKLALITPRYGAEITTGPEYVCRRLAEQLAQRHSVEVITTCAQDPRTWLNVCGEGTERVRGVVVRRFGAIPAQDEQETGRLAGRLFAGFYGRADEVEWARRAGPWSPGLQEFLSKQHRNYDALVFFSWQHATTLQGLRIAPERSILVPWLQVTPELRLGIAQETLAAPAGMAYLSAWERGLARVYARTPVAHDDIVGIGVAPPPMQAYPRIELEPEEQPEADDLDAGDPPPQDEWAKPHLTRRGSPFRRRRKLDGQLVLYGGRFDSHNGCEEMLEYFDAYAAAYPDEASLVLLGAKMMKVPPARALVMGGMLTDRERPAAFEAADITVAPSADDLCGEAVLESLSAGTPVLASAGNAAAVEHCRRSNGGLYYANREEFVATLHELATNETLRDTLGRGGREYASQHYRWDAVIGRLDRLVTRIRPH
ncbi:MAG: glycosyltransferase family 4 protein [Vicinamibacterales bacterium]|nr:glycosyltransferase family 4 protein [Vicinamibacterales bacterium]